MQLSPVYVFIIQRLDLFMFGSIAGKRVTELYCINFVFNIVLYMVESYLYFIYIYIFATQKFITGFEFTQVYIYTYPVFKSQMAFHKDFGV